MRGTNYPRGGGSTVLFLGANRSHQLTIRALRRAGIHVIGVNDLGDPLSGASAAEWWEISPSDRPTLVHRAGAVKSIQAILTASEGEAAAAIELADALNLPFPKPWPIDKWAQRQSLNTVPSLRVEACLLGSRGDTITKLEARPEWIIKPRMSRGGSRGVRLVQGPGDLELTAKEAADRAPVLDLIAEEVLDGPQLTIDAVVHDGEATVLGVARNVKQGGTYQVNIAIVWDQESRQYLPNAQVMVQQIAELWGVSAGLLHVEAAVTTRGLRPIEVAHRQGGGVVPDAVALASGRHPVVDAVAPESVAAGQPQPSVVILYLIGPPAHLAPPVQQPDPETLRGGASPGVADTMLFLPPDGRIAPLTSTSARIGHVLAYGSTTEEAFVRATTAAKSFTLLRDDGTPCRLLIPHAI